MNASTSLPMTEIEEQRTSGPDPKRSVPETIDYSSIPVPNYFPPPPKHPKKSQLASESQGEQSRMRSMDVDRPASGNTSANQGLDLAATKGPLPSILFAIPFPEPAPHVQRTKKTPLFLLYSFPRAGYQKPPVGPDGKRGKEGLIKKVERKWQEEVQEGADIKKGKLKEPSGWQRFKGGATRTATRLIKWLPDSNIETLGRLPPGKKIGYVTIVYPHEIDEVRRDAPPRTAEEIKDGLDKILNMTRKRAVVKTTISAFLLPVTAAIDFFCIVPLFLFEINLVYFTLQVNGARKVGTLARANNRGNKPVKAKKKKQSLKNRFRRRKAQPEVPQDFPVTEETQETQEVTEVTEDATAMATSGQDREETSVNIFNVQKSRPNVFQPILAHLYSVCSQLDRSSFPAKPQSDHYQTPSYIPTPAMISELIRSFREWVPEDVALRHDLDENVVAEDLGRCLKKASKEYIKSLKGRTGKKFSM
ncbi:uncharacterized protein MELLADRAFT_115123 [Melampsora larici-populina 98AG31]|uniref:Secreted protein n=1 Tax=Melampsora larici-populina (strain 98AG31 / pathotype 3-4-7) TaxID=747676 RepID=F4R5J4_MELLP|nr:uncharacterized protein MELLADRAFT_115123 [Melampsora larici-populina 98AG31]EGG12252.1 secreted protein [Melampsora larici-populina 98AG31]